MQEDEDPNVEKLSQLYGEIRREVVQSAPHICQEAIRFATEKRFDEALALFRKAVEVDPEYGYAWSDMGICLLQTNKVELLDEARDALDKASQLLPDDFKNCKNLAVACICTRRLEDAKKCLAQCRRLIPDGEETIWLAEGIAKAEKGTLP